METQNLRHRASSEVREEPEEKSGAKKDDRRIKMAKRGVRSLSVAVLVPVLLTLVDIYLFGRGSDFKAGSLSPLWLLHTACLGSTLLMGLSAWLVWVEGGFHKNPAALALYLGQLAMSLAWDPIVVWAGASRAGLVACAGMVGALLGCLKVSKEVHPVAAELIRPCLAWAAFVSIVTLKLCLSVNSLLGFWMQKFFVIGIYKYGCPFP